MSSLGVGKSAVESLRRLASTFTDSIARLTGDEQKTVKTTALCLQVHQSAPSHPIHKLDRARDYFLLLYGL